MDRHPSDRILDDWDSLASGARRPAEAPRRRTVRGSFGLGSLVPLVAAALVVAVGIAWLGGREIGPGTNGSPSPTGLISGASSSPLSSPTTPSPEPSASCDLVARILSWEGAAGSRIATVELVNEGTASCTVPASAHPTLVDGSGRGLAFARLPLVPDPTIKLEPDQKLTTLVQVSNVCGDPPVAPVTISFDFGDGTGVDAQPLSPDDVTVPPCNGPDYPASIEMHPWSRS